MTSDKPGLPALNSQIIDENGSNIEVSLELDEAEKVSIDVYDQENPSSVYNIFPVKFLNYIDNIPESLREMDYQEIRKVVKPTPTLNQLRLKFWYEYDRISFEGGQFSIYRVAKGICNPQQLQKYMMNPEYMAYILTPIKSYEIQVHDALETALFKLRTSLENIEITNAKDLSTVLRVYETFDKRVNGDYKKNINLGGSVSVQNNQDNNSGNNGQLSNSQQIRKYIQENGLENKVK